MPDIPPAYFREYVPDAPEVSGPDADDRGLVECPECGMATPKDTRCPCGDCETCGGDGAVRRSNGRTTNRYQCNDCNGTGRVS